MTSITVHIKPTATPNVKLSVTLDTSATVLALKEQLAGSSSVPVDSQRLIYKGQILKDDRTLESYGIVADHTLHLVRGRSTAEPATTVPAAFAGSPGQTLPATPGLLGMGGGDMQSMMNPSPESMQRMMQTPMMQAMLQNPELMRTMMQNNPMIQQLTERNPEIAAMLNDPAILRQSMQIASNPGLMRENMRNVDRAMSNIESMPEGFNALRRMFETVQEPLMQAADSMHPMAGMMGAAQGTATQGSQVAGSTPDNQGTANAAPLPNPWAPPGTQGSATPTQTPAQGAAAGLPGLGTMPMGMGGMGMGAGGMPGMRDMMQMMEQPGMRQMMSQMMSSPGVLDGMINSNPQMRQMVDDTPGMRQMMANPELMNSLMRPEVLQGLQGMGGFPGLGGGGGEPEGLPNMIQAMGLFPGAGAPAMVADPVVHYASQLAALADMGFMDQAANLRALQASGGNVHAAVERLLSGM